MRVRVLCVILILRTSQNCHNRFHNKTKKPFQFGITTHILIVSSSLRTFIIEIDVCWRRVSMLHSQIKFDPTCDFNLITKCGTRDHYFGSDSSPVFFPEGRTRAYPFRHDLQSDDSSPHWLIYSDPQSRCSRPKTIIDHASSPVFDDWPNDRRIADEDDAHVVSSIQ